MGHRYGDKPLSSDEIEAYRDWGVHSADGEDSSCGCATCETVSKIASEALDARKFVPLLSAELERYKGSSETYEEEFKEMAEQRAALIVYLMAFQPLLECIKGLWDGPTGQREMDAKWKLVCAYDTLTDFFSSREMPEIVKFCLGMLKA